MTPRPPYVSQAMLRAEAAYWMRQKRAIRDFYRLGVKAARRKAS